MDRSRNVITVDAVSTADATMVNMDNNNRLLLLWAENYRPKITSRSSIIDAIIMIVMMIDRSRQEDQVQERTSSSSFSK